MYTLATKPAPHLKAEIAGAYGATYVSTRQTSMGDLAKKVGRPDLVFEATGNAEACFRAMEVLAETLKREPDNVRALYELSASQALAQQPAEAEATKPL